MEIFIDFLINNYLWVLIIFLIIIFALIGYLVDSVNPKNKSKINNNQKNIINYESKVHPSVEVYTNEDFDEPLMKDKNI